MSQVRSFCRKMCASNRGLRVSANLHIIIGMFSMCFGIVEIGDDVERYYHEKIPVPCLSILMGFWFLVTGIVGVLAGRYDARLFKVLVIVYIFFSMTSISCACLMTACYYLTIKFWKYVDTYPAPYAITWVITILGSIQIVVSLWAFVCSWTSIDPPCCCHSFNLDVRPQTQLPIERNLSSAPCASGASNAFVLYWHDNVVIAEASSGSNQNFSGASENMQIGNNIGNEEMPPSYETALQDSNLITEVTTVNTESVGGPDEGLCGTPEIHFQTMRNEELLPSYEMALQNDNSITELIRTVTTDSGALQYVGPPPCYRFVIENDSNA